MILSSIFRISLGDRGDSPSTKKLKTRVTGVTQQTDSNKGLGRKR
jgi:hypothetical protein